MRPSDSARLCFRRWSADDVELAQSLWGDPRVTALIDSRGALGAEQVRERLEREVQLEREHGVQYWPIFLREGGALAGCCGLHPRAPGVFELGFHLCADAWGRGFATEAARAVIAHAFGPLGAIELFAGHHPRNDASRAVLEKLGFCFTHRERYPPTGLDHPSYRLPRPGQGTLDG